MIETRIDALQEPFRSAVQQLLAEAMERRVYFVVTETVRSYERQKELLDAGKTTTMRSKHLTGRAIDLAPVLRFNDGTVQEVTWDKEYPAWAVLGELADKYDLRWGGRWSGFPDYPHLEARNY